MSERELLGIDPSWEQADPTFPGDGPSVLRVSGRRGQIGTITLENGQLTGSTPGIQGIADTGLKRAGGDPAAAMRWLDGWSNGYVWAES